MVNLPSLIQTNNQNNNAALLNSYTNQLLSDITVVLDNDKNLLTNSTALSNNLENSLSNYKYNVLDVICKNLEKGGVLDNRAYDEKPIVKLGSELVEIKTKEHDYVQNKTDTTTITRLLTEAKLVKETGSTSNNKTFTYII